MGVYLLAPDETGGEPGDHVVLQGPSGHVGPGDGGDTLVRVVVVHVVVGRQVGDDLADIGLVDDGVPREAPPVAGAQVRPGSAYRLGVVPGGLPAHVARRQVVDCRGG